MTFFRILRTLRTTSLRHDSDRGATAVGYALLVAGVAIVLIVSVSFLGASIGGGVASAAGAMTTGAGTTGAEPGQSAEDQAAAEQAAAEQAAAEQEAAAEAARVAAEQAAAKLKSCNPSVSFDADGQYKRDYAAPTKCDTTTGKWVCPSGYKFSAEDGEATCKKD